MSEISLSGDSWGVQCSWEVVLLVTEFCVFVCNMFTSWRSLTFVFFVFASCVIGSCVSFALFLIVVLYVSSVF